MIKSSTIAVDFGDKSEFWTQRILIYNIFVFA